MTNRTRIYRALREAGPEGLTRTHLWEVVRAPCSAHIESLRAEGFEIEDVRLRPTISTPAGIGRSGRIALGGGEWGWALVGERRVAA